MVPLSALQRNAPSHAEIKRMKNQGRAKTVRPTLIGIFSDYL